MGQMAYWQGGLRQLASLPLGDAHPGGTWPYARGEQLRGSAATTPRAAGPFYFCRPKVLRTFGEVFSSLGFLGRCGGRGGRLRRLDDVAVRVEGAPLAVGPVSSREDVADALELPL